MRSLFITACSLLCSVCADLGSASEEHGANSNHADKLQGDQSRNTGTAQAIRPPLERNHEFIRRELTSSFDLMANFDRERDDRRCGEVIETMMDPQVISGVVNQFVGTLDTIFSDPANVGGVNYTDFFGIVSRTVNRPNVLFQAKNGYKAVKVCGTCNMVRKVMRPREFRRGFCGRNAYGSDAKFSGLALIPIKAGTDEILEGALKGAVFSHGIQSDSFNVPSAKWPSEGLQGIFSDIFYFIDLLGAVMAASSGLVSVLPDNLGYGESRDCYKGVFVKELYKTSSVPIWLSTKKAIAKMSDCKSELGDAAIVSGYSEGGYGAPAVAEALDSIGVNVIKLQAGTPSVDLVSILDNLLSRVLADTFVQRFAYVAPFVTAAYSSTVPGLANFNKQGQNILSDAERRRVVEFVLASFAIPDLRALSIGALNLSGNGNAEVVNKNIFNDDVVNATLNGNGGVCDPRFGLDDLCEALQDNNLKSAIEGVSYPVDICQSPFDDLLPYVGPFPPGTPPTVDPALLRPSLFDFLSIADPATLTNIYVHATTLPVCILIQAFTAIDDMTTVQATGRFCKKQGSGKGKHGKNRKKGY